MNMLRRKLTSQSGASITYALLLFLVCAVVGSVVLAAGTAAAGRMSKSVESDQRYYAVTSAARVLKDELNGNSNTIVIRDENNNEVYDAMGGDSFTFDGGAIPVILGITDYASAVAAGVKPRPEEPIVLTLTTNVSEDSPAVTVSESIVVASTTEPKLKLDISYEQGDGAYRLCLTMTGVVETVTRTIRNASGDEIQKVTKKVTWNYDNVETISITN